MKRILSVIVGVLLLCGTAFAAGLPTPTSEAIEGPIVPIAQCGANFGIYMRTWDLNPATQAGLNEVGYYEMTADGRPMLGDPVLVVVIDDAGRPTVYLKEKGVVRVLSDAEVQSIRRDPCELIKYVRIEVQG